MVSSFCLPHPALRCPESTLCTTPPTQPPLTACRLSTFLTASRQNSNTAPPHLRCPRAIFHSAILPSLPPSPPTDPRRSMSFNPCPAGAPPAWYPGEGLLSSTEGVNFSLSLGRLSPSQPTANCKAKGTLHLTNIRLLFIAAKPAPSPLPGGPEFSSFDVVSFRERGRVGRGEMGWREGNLSHNDNS